MRSPIATVVGEPKLAGSRMPIKPNRVADSTSVNFPIIPVVSEGVRLAHDGREPSVISLADVAGGAKGNI